MSEFETDLAVSPWYRENRKRPESFIDLARARFWARMVAEHGLRMFSDLESQSTVVEFEHGKKHITAVGKDYRLALDAAVNHVHYGAPIRYVGVGKFGVIAMVYWDCDKAIAYKYADGVKKELEVGR